MQNKLIQSQSLKQELGLSMGQMQSLEILHLPLALLEQRIMKEIEVNPTLEVDENPYENSSGDLLSEHIADSEGKESQEAADLVSHDEALLEVVQMDENWRDRVGSANSNPDLDEARQFRLDSYSRGETLEDFLLSQLTELELEAEQEGLCQDIIGSLDEHGYFVGDDEALCKMHSCGKRDLKAALKVVQKFEPLGIASRDLKECLLTQLDQLGLEKSPAAEIVKKHLDEISNNHIPQVAKKMRLTPNKLYEELEVIKKLQPYPASQWKEEESNEEFVSPDVIIDKDENDQWQVRPVREFLPRLQISSYYIDMLEDPDSSKEAKKYIREKINASKQILSALDQRESTIMRIARQILKRQEAFFNNGVEKLLPLTMQKVAKALDLHETTISRAVGNKYLQSPQGLLPFRYFFNSGYMSVDGTMLTSRAVKQEIADFVTLEDPLKPLSDGDLEEQFTQRGFQINRRAISKLREELGIAPAKLRKKF